MPRASRAMPAGDHPLAVPRELPATGLGRDSVVGCQGPEFEELADHLLKAGHVLRFRARGSSMHPLVRDGDILVVRPVEKNEPKVGDIVLYRAPVAGIVVHRIAKMRGQGDRAIFVVQGDASRRADPEVPRSLVLGRVVTIERQGRSIMTGSWSSTHAAPLYRQIYRLRRWGYLALSAARGALGRVTGVSGRRS